MDSFVDVFTESGTWIRPDGVDSVDVWIVAGGGSGGKTSNSQYGPGGGGAGGARLVEGLEVTDDVAVTVGEGGAAVTDALEAGLDGGESSFGSESCVGGGGGASGIGILAGGTGRAGGSGGGGSGSNVGGVGTVDQGNDGGSGTSSSPWRGGGGGGKSAAGTDGAGGFGTGGAGVSGPDWVPEGTYAQGGTGGLWSGPTDAHGEPGADGFGGGGRGIHYQGAASGPGGNGVVVVRYVTSDVGTVTTISDALPAIIDLVSVHVETEGIVAVRVDIADGPALHDKFEVPISSTSRVYGPASTLVVDGPTH